MYATTNQKIADFETEIGKTVAIIARWKWVCSHPSSQLYRQKCEQNLLHRCIEALGEVRPVEVDQFSSRLAGRHTGPAGMSVLPHGCLCDPPACAALFAAELF